MISTKKGNHDLPVRSALVARREMPRHRDPRGGEGSLGNSGLRPDGEFGGETVKQ